MIFKHFVLKSIKSKATYLFITLVVISFLIDYIVSILCTNEFFSFLLIKNTSTSFFESLFGITVTIVTLQAVFLPLIIEKSEKIVCGCSLIEVLFIGAWPLNPFHLIYISIALLPFQYYFSASKMLASLVFIFILSCIILFILIYIIITFFSKMTISLTIIKIAIVKAITKKKKQLWNYIYFCIQNKVADGLLQNKNSSIENAIEIADLFEYIYLNSHPKQEFQNDIYSLVMDISQYSNIEVTIAMLKVFIKSLSQDEEILANFFSSDVEIFMKDEQNCLLKNLEVIAPFLNKLIQNRQYINSYDLNILRVALASLPYVSSKFKKEIKELDQS